MYCSTICHYKALFSNPYPTSLILPLILDPQAHFSCHPLLPPPPPHPPLHPHRSTQYQAIKGHPDTSFSPAPSLPPPPNSLNCLRVSANCFITHLINFSGSHPLEENGSRRLSLRSISVNCCNRCVFVANTKLSFDFVNESVQANPSSMPYPYIVNL